MYQRHSSPAIKGNVFFAMRNQDQHLLNQLSTYNLGQQFLINSLHTDHSLDNAPARNSQRAYLGRPAKRSVARKKVVRSTKSRKTSETCIFSSLKWNYVFRESTSCANIYRAIARQRFKRIPPRRISLRLYQCSVRDRLNIWAPCSKKTLLARRDSVNRIEIAANAHAEFSFVRRGTRKR